MLKNCSHSIKLHLPSYSAMNPCTFLKAIIVEEEIVKGVVVVPIVGA